MGVVWSNSLPVYGSPYDNQQRIHLSSPANEYCNEINLLQYMVSMEFQTTWLLDSITTFIPT